MFMGIFKACSFIATFGVIEIEPPVAESIKASALHEAGKVDAAPSVAAPVEGVMGARVAEPAEYTVESLSGVVLENNIDRSSTQDYAVLLQK